MGMVLLTALGVGGATIIGAILGVVFKKISHQFSDVVLSFAAGVMVIAVRIHLFPFRTEKLSSPSPMVLPYQVGE